MSAHRRSLVLLTLVAGTALAVASEAPASDDRSATGEGVAADGRLAEGAVPAICHLLAKGRYARQSIFDLLDGDDDHRVGAADLAKIMSGEQAAQTIEIADSDADKLLTPEEVVTQAKGVTNGPFVAGLFGATGGRSQAWAAFGRQRVYIRDYDVAPGGNLDPQIGVIGTGNVINLGELRIMRRRR